MNQNHVWYKNNVLGSGLAMWAYENIPLKLFEIMLIKYSFKINVGFIYNQLEVESF